ncbi:MAG: hypothetical protein MR021_06880 [Clostridiales bacterium]|nr:hypothetical protein [Clostridiales bacterium]
MRLKLRKSQDVFAFQTIACTVLPDRKSQFRVLCFSGATIVRRLITEKEYVELLIGRDGEFDQIVSSTVRRAKRGIRDDNSELIWVMAYLKSAYANNADSFNEYYDGVEVCEEAARSHPKSAIQTRNRSMVDRSDLVICYVDHQSGGAFQTMQYAQKCGKKVISLAEEATF